MSLNRIRYVEQTVAPPSVSQTLMKQLTEAMSLRCWAGEPKPQLFQPLRKKERA